MTSIKEEKVEPYKEIIDLQHEVIQLWRERKNWPRTCKDLELAERNLRDELEYEENRISMFKKDLNSISHLLKIQENNTSMLNSLIVKSLEHRGNRVEHRKGQLKKLDDNFDRLKKCFVSWFGENALHSTLSSLNAAKVEDPGGENIAINGDSKKSRSQT